MKVNKGFGVLALILMLAGVAAFGGGAYYLGTQKKATQNNYDPYGTPTPTLNSNTTPNTTQTNTKTDCLLTTAPWIKILSPNGGETYTAGQEITVKWKSCNLNHLVILTLSGYPYPNDSQFLLGSWVDGKVGSESVTIPSNVKFGKYVINISTPPETSNGAEDWSDNFFIINSTNSSTISMKEVTIGGIKISYPSAWQIRNPIPNSCQSIMCQTSAAMSGNLDYKLYYPSISVSDNQPNQNVIYISARFGDGGCSSSALPCPLGYAGQNLKTTKIKGLVIQTESTNTEVVNLYNQIISKIKDNPSIKVLSPNGGEVYQYNSLVPIKWSGAPRDSVAIYLRSSDGGWCFIKQVPSTNTSYSFTPNIVSCHNGKVISSGLYKVTLISYEKEGMAPEPGTAFAGDYKDGESASYSIDSSDNFFTINY